MKIIAIILLALGLASCGTSIAGGSNSSGNSVASSSAAKASFSCLLNGKAISGNGVDESQLQNSAFVYPDSENGNHILFILCSTKNGSDTKPDYSFRMMFPDKTGTFICKGEDEFNVKTMPSVTLDFRTGDLSRYWIGARGDVATVTINAIDARHITGTFQAAMSLSNDTPNGAVKKITVTEGKFDIPFSTGNLRPE